MLKSLAVRSCYDFEYEQQVIEIRESNLMKIPKDTSEAIRKALNPVADLPINQNSIKQLKGSKEISLSLSTGREKFYFYD